MLITKAINNNVVLAEDDNGRELVLFGKGLGFRGAPSHLDDESCIQRSFRDVSPELYEALASISAEVIIIASGIVDIARQELNSALNPNLIFTIADHLQFAIERTRKGVVIRNPLFDEVRFVYPREYEVGRRGVLLSDAVAEDIKLPESEAASIALHIVNAESVEEGGSAALEHNMDLIVKSTEAIEEATGIVERVLGIAIDRSSYSYVRFVTHMRFLISRLIRGEKFESRNGSLFKQAAKDFSDEYACARAIDEYLRSSHGWSCTDEELLYLMMHVNRLCASYSRS
ncbi:PRD domain-containing protein [Paratractidigestivibacter sp.]|uniref:PRD domain-containing protein n=1 Tax=Paratractidigestivibacter sp. TaxID=2847316 RepID=UPI002ABE3CAD|nr:PRD domain-containing protein [Paratractidigestivibacter sp.]